MTFIWLIVWLCNGTPVFAFGSSWTIGLFVCAALDTAYWLKDMAKERHRR